MPSKHVRPRATPSELTSRQQLVVDCARLDIDGAGVGELTAGAETWHVHVSGGLPGERLAARVAHVSPHQHAGARDVWADLDEVLVPAPDRVAAPCGVLARCQSCALMPWAYSAQIGWKRGVVEQAFAPYPELAGLTPADCVPSPRQMGYRNNAKYVYGHDAQGRPLLGAYAPRSHEVVDMVECHTSEPVLREGANALLVLLGKGAVAPFHETQRTGLLRYVLMRANADGRVLVTLVIGREQWPEAGALAGELMRLCPAVIGVVLNINTSAGNALFGARETLLAGQDTLEDRVGGIQVRLGSRSFFQANREVAALAYQHMARAAQGLPEVRRVVDAYAGAGGIAFTLAPYAREVVAIEENAAATEAARAAAWDLVRNRVRFVTGDVADHLRDIGQADLVVLNPPRKGCEPRVIEAVAQLQPRLVAYLSCDPKTQARDLAQLVRLGYRDVSATPYDMLPQTPHVESLVFVERS